MKRLVDRIGNEKRGKIHEPFGFRVAVNDRHGRAAAAHTDGSNVRFVRDTPTTWMLRTLRHYRSGTRALTLIDTSGEGPGLFVVSENPVFGERHRSGEGRLEIP